MNFALPMTLACAFQLVALSCVRPGPLEHSEPFLDPAKLVVRLMRGAATAAQTFDLLGVLLMISLRLLLPIILGSTALCGLSACDKEAGRKQEAVGKVESGVGKVFGDEDLKAEGKGDKVAGQLKQGELKGAVKDAAK